MLRGFISAFTVYCLLVVLPDCGLTQVPGCTTAQARHAEDQTDHLHTWDSLYKWYKAYQRCDDGGIAEGISEDVGRILADHWSTLPRFDQLARQDAGFKKFIIKHVDTTLRDDDLKKIMENANTKCPTGLQSICGELRKQANTALAESDYPDKKS